MLPEKEEKAGAERRKGNEGGLGACSYFLSTCLGRATYFMYFGSLNPHSNSHHSCIRDKEIESQKIMVILVSITTALCHL